MSKLVFITIKCIKSQCSDSNQKHLPAVFNDCVRNRCLLAPTAILEPGLLGDLLGV